VPAGFNVLFGDSYSPMDDRFYGALSSLEVEENADLPDAISLGFTVNRTDDGDYDFPNEAKLAPFATVAVVATPPAGSAQCIFDGCVLSHRLHVASGSTGATLTVWGQDRSWLMNLEEKVREFVDMTDAQVANQIFGEYENVTPADENEQDDSPSHTEDGHSLMQRGSDIEFLRSLARRNGKLCRVACRDQAGQRVGIFARPKLDGDPVATITLNDPEKRSVEELDFSWDVSRPSQANASQALFDDDTPEGVSADADASGLDPLDERDLATFAGRPMTVLLTAPVDDGGELQLRSQAVLRESGWFVRSEGETSVDRLGAVLRVGDVVEIDGVGSLNSGKYLVWSVRHTIAADAHRMRFVLYRNAVGPPPSGGGGGLLGGLLG
jgi:Phage tail baseplate hub (GPD)